MPSKSTNRFGIISIRSMLMFGGGVTLIGLGMRIIVEGDVNQLSEVVLKDLFDIYARIFIFSWESSFIYQFIHLLKTTHKKYS